VEEELCGFGGKSTPTGTSSQNVQAVVPLLEAVVPLTGTGPVLEAVVPFWG
jgi:hypothetical protein